MHAAWNRRLEVGGSFRPQDVVLINQRATLRPCIEILPELPNHAFVGSQSALESVCVMGVQQLDIRRWQNHFHDTAGNVKWRDKLGHTAGFKQLHCSSVATLSMLRRTDLCKAADHGVCQAVTNGVFTVPL